MAMLGRLDEAIAEPTRDFALKAFLLMRVGRFRDASEVIAAGIRRPIENESRIGHASGHLMSSLLALEQGQYSRAREAIDEARRILGPLPRNRQRVHLVLADTMAGLVEVRGGSLDRARQHLASQQRSYSADNAIEKAWHGALAGEIALAEGRLAEAEAAFASGEPAARVWISLYLDYPWALMTDLPARDGIARVAKARGDVAGAIRIYRRLLAAGPERKWPGLYEPRFVLEMARLLEESGDGRGALAEYQRFLALWKGADGSQPELGEARRAVSRLRTS
jgi:tetratricopeptide (TPR) repeat protein